MTDLSSIAAEKDILRKQVLARRKSMPEVERI